MKPKTIQITVEISAVLYRNLRERAAAQGCSVQDFILTGVKATQSEHKRLRTRRVRFPLIVSKGPKVNLTNEQIYERVGFP